MAKKDLNEYLTKVGKLKPSAEVKVKTRNDDGTVTEQIASRTYVSKHIAGEVDIAKKIPGLSDRLNRVTENATQKIEDDIDDIEKEIDDEQLDENATVELNKSVAFDEDEESPFTHVPNSQQPSPTTEQMSEAALLIKLVSQLIDKIDEMQNFNPVIHVPAPVIHVTLPETKKTITRAVERDDEGFIKSIREHIEEAPEGEPLIEVKEEKSRRKTKPKKDSE